MMTIGLMFVLLISSLISFSDVTSASTVFSKELAGGRAEAMIQADDGGYVMAGSIFGPFFEFIDSFIVKLDSNGRVVWTRRFKGPANITGSTTIVLKKITEVMDGYVAIGDAVNDDGSLCILKLDKQGKLLWAKSVSSHVAFSEGSIARTKDDGFIVSSVYDDNVTRPVLVMKFNGSGEIVWQKTYDASTRASSIFQTPDGGYLLAGGPNGNEPETSRFVLLKLTANGEIQWKKILTFPNSNTFGQCILLSDGGYALVASHNEKDAVVIQFNSHGSLISKRSYGPNVGDSTRISQTAAGDLLVATGNDDEFIFKLNSSGALLWQRQFGGTQSDFFVHSVGATADGGFAVSGWNSVKGKDFAFLMKFDNTGETSSCSKPQILNLTMTTATVKLSSGPINAESSNVTVTDISIPVTSKFSSFRTLCP